MNALRRAVDQVRAAHRRVAAGPRTPLDHMVVGYGRWLALLLPQRTRAAIVRTNVNSFLAGVAEKNGGWVTVDELLAASNRMRNLRPETAYAFDEIFDVGFWLRFADRDPARRPSGRLQLVYRDEEGRADG